MREFPTNAGHQDATNAVKLDLPHLSQPQLTGLTSLLTSLRLDHP